METEAKDGILVVRERSGYRCVRDGVSLVFKHFTKMARFLWPLAVVYVVCDVVMFHSQRCVVFAGIAGNMWVVRGYALCATLLTTLANVAYQSGIAWQQRALAFTGALPGGRLCDVWRAVLGVAWRVLKMGIVITIVFSLFILLCAVLCVPSLPAGASSVGRWLVVVAEWGVAVFLFMVLLGASWQVFYEYVLGGVSLCAAVGSLGWGRRYLGRSILLAFVCTLLSAVVAVVMSLPAIVCSCIDGIALEMAFNGELAQLPSHYPYVLLLSWLLSAVGQCLAFLLVAFPMCLNWGAIRATEINRRGKEDGDAVSLTD